jgi:cytoskeletal protein CcmA (bactofilin family)
MSTPRRFWIPLLAVALAAVVAGTMRPICPRVGFVSRRIEANTEHTIRFAIASALRALGSVDRLVIAPANAEDRLRFEPVPPESVSEFERRSAARAARKAALARTAEPVPDEDEAADSVVTPEPPESPAVPAVPGKSGNITRLGSDIVIAADQVVVGDVVALGGDVTVAGRVEGDVAAMGGDVYLKSTARVDGDVVCMGGRLNEESGASVGGQRVSGLGTRHARVRRMSHVDFGESGAIAASIMWLLVLLGLGWAFTRLGPGRTAAAAATLRHEPAMSIGIGALIFALIIPSVIALALVVAILCITIIGIPFGLAAILAYMLFLCVVWGWGFVVAAVVVGGFVLHRLASGPHLHSSALPPVPGSVPSGYAAPPALGAPPSLTRCAMTGILLLAGTNVAGRILQSMGPLHALGTLVHVLAAIAWLVALTFGSGAWLRTEIKAGTLARWWRGSQWGRGTPVPAGASPGAGMPPPPPVNPAWSAGTPPAPHAPYAPPAPPSPPASYAPSYPPPPASAPFAPPPGSVPPGASPSPPPPRVDRPDSEPPPEPVA